MSENVAVPSRLTGKLELGGARTLRRVILPVLILVLLVAIVGVFGALRAQRTAFLAVDHSEGVQQRIDSALSSLKDAALGQQAYLLTDDRRALEPYQQAVEGLPAAFASLAQLTQDDAVQKRLLSELVVNLQQYLADLADTISLQDARHADLARETVRLERSSATMRQMRAGLAQMEGEEQRLLVERKGSAATARLITLYSVGTMGLIALLLLWLLYRVMARDADVILASEERLAATLESVRESEARFRDIADATPVLIWISDVHKNCIWFNSRWLNFTGRTIEQERGSGWIDGVHPADLSRCVAVYDAAFERREAYRTEYRRQRADGEWRTLDASGVPRYDQGAFVGYIGSCIDVTDQRLAARALADNEEQLRLATEAAEIGLWDADMTAGTLYWPARVKAMFGLRKDRPVTLDDFYAGLHPEDREATTTAFSSALDPKLQALYDVEYRTVGLEDGVTRWVAAKGRAIFREGACVRVLGTAIDITRRKASEAQLRELNEQLERRVNEALAERRVLLDIIEATDARILVLDTGFRILAINRATAGDLEELFGGIKPKVGDNLLALIDHYPAQRALVESYWGRALRGEEFTATDEFGDPDTERRYYEMKFNTLRDSSGRLLGAFQFVYDVTARLREQARLADAEYQLRQTQKFDAIGQLSGGIAHDFNNLLMVISGGLGLLQRAVDGAKRQRIIEQMRHAADRGASLSRQLLTFARRQPLHAAPVDLRHQINGMREILDRTLRGDVLVTTDLPEGLWPIFVDAAEFELVILNLCVNARDAMPAGGTITISARNAARLNENELAGDFVVLTVADTGTGIPADVLSRVFEPFFTTKELGKGSGLGLAQVYGFTQQSGGAVKLESVPGHGTTARLVLPRSDVALVPPVPTEQTGQFVRPRLPAGSILLVEDSEEVAALVADMLVELGYRVTRVASAQAALGALANDREIDVVFSDVMMPGPMNGVDLAREIVRRRPDLPVLLTTGYAGAALTRAYDDHIDVLSKPYELADLDAALRSVRKRRPKPGDPDRA